MESLIHGSSSIFLTKQIISGGNSVNRSSSFKNGHGWSFSPQKLSFGLRKAVIVGAKKDNKNKKEDTHSFIPKPDEATGYFPEAVLLKEKKVQEDGRVLPDFADAEEEELFELLNLQLQSESDVTQKRHYEVVYIIHEKHEEEVGSVNEKVQEFLREKKAKIWRLNDWGLRRLAYKIKKAKNGHYILMNFELEGQWINDFKTMLDKDERVIRHLVMKADEAITEDCPPPPEFHTLRADCDVDLLEFPLNLEYLEAEFFLFGSLGFGLDKVAPNLTSGGPPPIGVRKANLDPFTRDTRSRTLENTVKGFPRPLLDLSAKSFAKVVDKAFGRPLSPPFDPYCNSINYLLASYLIPYVGLTGYVGANPKLQGSVSKRLVAGLLGVESGQDAVIRAYLYRRRLEPVQPYGISVAEFTERFSDLRNKLGRKGLKDEGLIVPLVRGAEGKTKGNVLAGDQFSLSYDRTPEEILRIVYGTGNEGLPGGFFPKGGDGRIAKSHLHKA
ncbi:desiccation-related protein PCC13-62-like [Tripterygium wilfordii]|uniref:Desiccation-related protein PCC13-62-like n=1 Tax=Tripterygium wilfordii TaxID=458696 RepID=A0A7J7CXF3_TRIWF|nr:desiccation-related protein PCC13-62-like [Tripterygium wilfordii]